MRMLVADNSEINRAILSEIFGREYEFIETSGSEEFLRLLMHYKEDISVILVNESIARKISVEKAEMLEKLNVFKNTPVILILNREHSNMKNKIFIPYSDVIHSPVNPNTVKKRVGNLVELFLHKNELEYKVEQQMKKIVEQNEALKLKEEKINAINNDMLSALSTVIEYRDVESGKHIRRIQKFTEAILRVLAVKYPKYNIDEEKIALITSASSMHDIGKIAIPDAILLKPARLTPDEFQLMKMHTTKGCEILEQIDAVEKNDYYRYCYDICRYHHEKWDGLGYPDGLAGDDIPIWAQIVSLADCYDALTSNRPYKEAYSHEKAVEMIRDGACGAFSDEILDCFSMVLPKFRELSLKYADKNVTEDNTASRYVRDNKKSSDDDIYIKMDRDDLIGMIEHQKEMLNNTHQRDVEVFYAGSDYVFEFDLPHDTVHERKGSIKDICGYIPKNYEESIKLLSEKCQEEYRSEFIRKYRLKNMDKKCIAFECPMKLNGGNYCNVRFAAIPIFSEDGKITRVFISIIKLYETFFNHMNDISKDHDIVTGLWNFSGIKKEIEDYLENTGKNGYHLMILVDGDDFKKINSRTSYKFGSEILVSMSKELRSRIPESAFLARVEDDNFLIFIKDCPNRDECMLIVEEIYRSYHQKFVYNNEITIETTASVGAAVYPFDGDNFESLFDNVSKTVEMVKLNGKNMYMFYNSNMRDSWEIDNTKNTELLRKDTELQSMNFEKYVIPVINSESGHIISYDMIEALGDSEEDFSYIYDLYDESVSMFSLNSIRRLIAEIYFMQKENISLPNISLITAFGGDDCEKVIGALHEILKQYPVKCDNIYLMLSQYTLENMSVNKLSAFSAAVKSMGFGLGIYNFGSEHFDIKCFSGNFFDSIVFSGNFIKDISEGVYPVDLLVYFISYFDKAGISAQMPSNISDELIEMIKQNTSVPFGIHKGNVISLDEFRKQMKISAAVVEYPVLSHENTSLVLSEKIYDQVLEQTKSFIIEWTPRFDKIKISGSFKKLYGYEPDIDDFSKSLNENRFLHSDDIRKFLEKINSARYDNSYTESFIRVYSKKTNSYLWNKVKFVSIRDIANVPVKIIAVFADVSDESETFLDDSRRDRTDFITNLYNKKVTENKIKNCLCDEGAFTSNSLIIAEIVGYDRIEEELGTFFLNAVLKETAENIRELFRDSDIIGRNSGNRFMIFVKGMGYCDKLKEKAEQVCAVIKNRYQSEKGDIKISGKAGVSVFPRDGETYDELYSNALKALEVSVHGQKDVSFVFDIESNKKLLHD